MEKIPVTIIIPVYNEEANLPRCLSKLGSFSEILVVDSHSTDRTVHASEVAGAKVMQFRWNGRFPKKRNWALENHSFQTEWVLFLDADEEITPQFDSELSASIKDTKYAGFWIRYRNFFLGRELRFGVPQRKLALFRIGKGAYEKIQENYWSELDMEVHEHPIVDGPIGEIRAPLLHHSFKSIHAFVHRHNDYSSWEAHRYLKLRETGWMKLTLRQRVKYFLLASAFFPFAYFVFDYFIRAGFLDGRAGFHHALLKLAYFHQVILKIKELGAAPSDER